MRTLDGYLSRRAQARLGDPTALVYREDDETYTLEREGHAPLSLGQDFGAAQQALHALTAAHRARSDRGPD